jgi:RNA polymerase sigma-70 factor (ECF subfamily)
MTVMADQLPVPATSALSLSDFGSWMASEQKRVFLLCLRLLNDREEADSATQDAFLRAYESCRRNSEREIEDPARWITRIAVNTCMDRLRSNKWQLWRRRPDPEEEGRILGSAPSEAPDAERAVFAGEVRDRIAQALGKLSERQRAVFVLRHYEDLSLEEIGDTLKLDTGTVKAHMFRAVAKLRTELRDLYASGGVGNRTDGKSGE